MLLDLDQAVKTVQRLYDALQSRRPEIEQLDRYYRGEQPLAYASNEWKKFHAGRYRNFADNWCGVVANSPAERLRVGGFSVPQAEDPQDDVVTAAERALWGFWQANDLDEQSSQGFLSSIIAKRSFVLVWGDENDQPVITWEDPSQVVVDYVAENMRQRRFALKAWLDDSGMECATLYTPDEVWKFQRKAPTSTNAAGQTPSGLYVSGSASGSGSGWQQRQPPEDDTWPIPNPIGEVPVVEMKNRPLLGGRPLSDIAGSMAMQDAVNLLWAYAFTAADYASMPARVVMGQEPPKLPILDDNGQKIGEQPVKMEDLAQGRLLWLTGKDTTIGSFPAAQLDPFTTVIEVAVGHIASQTRTPPHYLAAGKGISNLSGDALKAAETGLVKKVEEQQLFFGPAVRDVFRLAALVAGDDGLADLAAHGVVKWRDAESRSEAQLVDALQKLMAIGFPFRWIAERYGLSDTEITRVIAMKQNETDTSLLGSAAAVLAGLPAGAGGA